ncbi:MAG: pilus assembly protein [Maritimibacter sp.]|nr:pilus assembly protein [Maritimibacter sp.]
MTRGVEHKRWARFCADEGGAAMVEFAIVSAVFFLAFFQLLGFGLFASTNLMAEKATQIAARTAVVRPAVDWCAETPLPDRITSSDPDLPEPPSFGTNCRNEAGTCTAVAEVSCTGVLANEGDLTTTDGEIWNRIAPMLPGETGIDDLRFTYTFDPNLGYLGGPYTPMVTVELTVPNETTELFALISRLAVLAGGGDGFTGPQYRTISISLPAEDLNAGTGG